MSFQINRLFHLLVFLFFLDACQSSSSGQYVYSPPAATEADLPVASLTDVNMDISPIEKAVERIEKGKYGEVHSLLISKNGKLVLEGYFNGHDYQWDAPDHYGELVQWTPGRTHFVHSVSKSIISLCIGIAIDKGFIRDVQQSVFDYMPEYEYLNTGDKHYINIEHLLSCTGGLQWAEWNAPLSSRENDQVNIWFHPKGPIDYYLQRPFVAVPGTLFNYSGGGIEVLGKILENASGMSVQAFSDEYLFGPLGLKEAEWNIIYPTGEYHVAAGLKLRPRDMLKIGMMMLQNGKWNDQQIVSPEWISKSSTSFLPDMSINVPGEDLRDMGYGYTWWTKDETNNGQAVHWFSANGWGGQKIVVLPEFETVIVLTGANYTSKVKEYRIISDYLYKAIRAD
ncbi:serine hydrolase domain-containing protein [Mangrovibacterium diazotrophicum]|uniref:CubicO group peptidase (Beta-lactamase class C family) n=1 Tax=Mangrovibacterium diazotrophicum TaxID=1261403 RepID=A0A419W4U3_9BACT|nr:serine hydrolase [Mangrovibacterium diazotrophicum]RKD90456.1 CubicO group peptidase (beta-lactamase class C family) [Mangrovibacterium diazotrophicum]